MQRTPCVRHPVQDLIIVRQWQLEYCDGNPVAAALLSHFEYRHSINLGHYERAEQDNIERIKAGQTPHPLPSLLYRASEQDLINAIMNVSRTKQVIRREVTDLEEKGIISVHKNPKDCSDQTKHYLFHPEVVNAWLDEHYPVQAEPTPPPYREEEHPETSPKPKNVTKTKLKQKPQLAPVTCPDCCSPMVKRENKKTKEHFYGCTHYPKCTCTLDAQKQPPRPPDFKPTQRQIRAASKKPPPDFKQLKQQLGTPRLKGFRTLAEDTT